MGNLTSVMGFKAFSQIFGLTGIVTLFILFTDKDVNIMEAFDIVISGLRSSRRFERNRVFIGLPRRSSKLEYLSIDNRSGFA